MGPRVPQNYQGGKEGERFSRESSLRRQQRFSTSALLTLGLRQSFVVGAASPHFHARTTLCTSPPPHRGNQKCLQTLPNVHGGWNRSRGRATGPWWRVASWWRRLGEEGRVRSCGALNTGLRG